MKLLHLTAILIALLLACGSPNSPVRDSSRDSDDRRRGDRNGSNDSQYFLSKSEIPTCSPGDCCEDDRECKGECNNYFSDSSAERLCYELPIDKGEELVEFLEELEEGNADDFDEESLEYFGLALSIDYEVWLDLIKDYSDGNESLNWLAENEEATNILLSLKKEYVVDIVKALLGDDSVQDILDGLTDEVDNDKTVMEVADESNNNDLIDFFHEDIIKEELCSGSHLPTPGNQYTGTAVGKAERNEEEACILGVYCAIFPEGSKERDRKEIAQTINDNDIERFIEDDIDDGGLSQNGRIDNASNWPDEACQALSDLWTDHSNLDLW